MEVPFFDFDNGNRGDAYYNFTIPLSKCLELYFSNHENFECPCWIHFTKNKKMVTIGHHFLCIENNTLLQAVTKIFAELFHQAVRPVAGWFQTTHEEAEHLGFVNKLQTANEVTIVVQPVHTVDYIVDL